MGKFIQSNCVVTLVAATACMGCDGYTRVSGRVIDESHRPINGAVVSLERIPGEDEGGKALQHGLVKHETTTEADGVYHVGYSHAPIATKSQLIVKKEGFKDYQEIITGSDIIDNHEIVLKQSDD